MSTRIRRRTVDPRSIDTTARKLAAEVLKFPRIIPRQLVDLANEVMAALSRRQEVRRASGARGGRPRRWRAFRDEALWVVYEGRTSKRCATFEVLPTGRLRRLFGPKNPVMNRVVREAMKGAE